VHPITPIQGERFASASRVTVEDTIQFSDISSGYRAGELRRETQEGMVADILHELNQPLGAIANYARASAHLLAADSIDLTEVRAALEQISAQAMRAAGIVYRLRTLPDNSRARTEREQ
jgi:C4-dicarboxylate-specific signal transduction histidine kinase